MSAGTPVADSTRYEYVKAKAPKLTSFRENVDNMDAFLERFERFARNHNWPEDSWAINLSALLTGKALEVYSRLDKTKAMEYEALKDALLKRYQLTEEGFRKKFREETPEVGETPVQFVSRLSNYLTRWLTFAKVGESYDQLFEHIVKEQFISKCDKDVAAYLREKKDVTLDDLTDLAERYMTAHNKPFGPAST